MKTAVSLPDPLFKEADQAAKKMKMSRSQFYAAAVAEYLDRRKAEAITAKLNEVYSREPAEVDHALREASLKVLDRW